MLHYCFPLGILAVIVIILDKSLDEISSLRHLKFLCVYTSVPVVDVLNKTGQSIDHVFTKIKSKITTSN